MENAAQGYFVQGEVLLREWCAQRDNVVVPVKFRALVLNASHNEEEVTWGFKNTYQWILR